MLIRFHNFMWSRSSWPHLWYLLRASKMIIVTKQIQFFISMLLIQLYNFNNYPKKKKALQLKPKKKRRRRSSFNTLWLISNVFIFASIGEIWCIYILTMLFWTELLYRICSAFRPVTESVGKDSQTSHAM